MEITADTPVLVTTAHRGVFFGLFSGWAGPESDPHKHISLKDARNCVYWSQDVRGFLGLATTGPTGGCKVGPKADMPELRDVTSISVVTLEATEKWEMAQWK